MVFFGGGQGSESSSTDNFDLGVAGLRGEPCALRLGFTWRFMGTF